MGDRSTVEHSGRRDAGRAVAVACAVERPSRRPPTAAAPRTTGPRRRGHLWNLDVVEDVAAAVTTAVAMAVAMEVITAMAGLRRTHTGRPRRRRPPAATGR